MKSRFIYSEKYDFSFPGLSKFHPFDGKKFSKAWNVVVSNYQKEITSQLVEPETAVSTERLLKVHTRQYLNSLSLSKEIAKVIEISIAKFIPNKILQSKLIFPIKLACAGTILATELALKERLMVMNFGGGFHHAFSDHGEGFCFFADAVLSINDSREKGLLGENDKILMIDLDAHRGNGFESLMGNDSCVKNFDMYNFQVYPGLHEGEIEDFPFMIPLKAGLKDNAYLTILKDELTQFLEQNNDAKLIFYNAGNDVVASDPLGGLSLSFDGVVERDRFVIKQLSMMEVPTVVMTSGGYTRHSYKLIAELAKTVFSFNSK